MMSINNPLKIVVDTIPRLKGLNEWGIIAEIWQHTDTAHPSDEDDILRLQDDFGG